MATRRLNLTRLLRPYWTLLAIAFVAMLVEGAADLLEPWPLKVIFDYVLGSQADAGVARRAGCSAARDRARPAQHRRARRDR